MSYVNSDLTDPFWRSERISELEAEVERLRALVKMRGNEGHLPSALYTENRKLREIEGKFKHLSSEYHFDQDRGDHLIYKHEWEAFDKWQRGQSDE